MTHSRARARRHFGRFVVKSWVTHIHEKSKAGKYLGALVTFGKSKEWKKREVLRDISPKEFRKILEKFKH